MRVHREVLRDAARAPVKIARGAFNGVLPHSDLYVSYRHCLLINGLLIPAGDLINGSSITRAESTTSDSLEYFHIELERRDVVFANGAPAETLQGDADRETSTILTNMSRSMGKSSQSKLPMRPLSLVTTS